MSFKELYYKVIEMEMHSLGDELLEVADSVIYLGASPHDAQEAIDHIQDDLDEAIAESKRTITAEELACKFGGFECEECE